MSGAKKVEDRALSLVVVIERRQRKGVIRSRTELYLVMVDENQVHFVGLARGHNGLEAGEVAFNVAAKHTHAVGKAGILHHLGRDGGAERVQLKGHQQGAGRKKAGGADSTVAAVGAQLQHESGRLGPNGFVQRLSLFRTHVHHPVIVPKAKGKKKNQQERKRLKIHEEKTKQTNQEPVEIGTKTYLSMVSSTD